MPEIPGIDTGAIGDSILNLFTSFFFWIIIMMVLGFIFILFLFYRRSRKFEFPCIEVIGLGEGKIRTNITKCGWFKKKKMFFNLYDFGGEDEMICKGKFGGRNRRILYASSTDYHDINGKRGIICKRKDDDPEILVPLNTFEVKNSILLGSIAPADYRDASITILEDKRKETLTWWDENKATLVLAGTMVFAIIALIIIFKFAQGESSEWREFALNALKNVNVATASPSAP